jgi:hypothetical protein
MLLSATEKCSMLALPGSPERCGKHHQGGQKVRFENEEAEIIRVSPLMVIKTKDRVVCGALRGRIQCLAA